jgi:hypothetical protein
MPYGDLTTLGDVKAWLQNGPNPFPDIDDALLSRLVTAASRHIETWIGRRVALADWREIRDGTGGQRLAFANWPVTAVISLTIDGLAIPPAPADGTPGAGYIFTATELALFGYYFTRRSQNVAVTYTAGYAVPPPELAQACVELVCLKYRERGRIGEVSKALGGGETVSFTQKDLPDSVKTVLMRYRAAAPVSAFAAAPASTATDPALIGAAL